MITVENDGPEIVSTNFWTTNYARSGAMYLTSNAGAFRLLIPDMIRDSGIISEFKTAKDVILSRGPMPATSVEAMEILFDDGSSEPYSIHLGLNQLDRLPSKENEGKEFIFSAWIQDRDGGLTKAFEHKCLYRRVPTLPYLKPR